MLGARFREYRLRANMTQREVSDQSGITVITISKFEAGQSNDLSFSTLLQLLRTIGRLDAIDELLPELPESPYLVKEDNHKVQRIRHRKQ